MTETIKHHLTDALLMGYSAGALPEAMNLMVATHLSLCDTCRAQMESFDILGGCLLEDNTDAVAMDAGALDATLAMLEDGEDVPARQIRASEGVFPGPLQDYVGGDLDSVRWKPIGMGVRQAILPTSGTASARLLYIPAGAAVPDHGHQGIELTMVLQGAFSDEVDRFARGDVEVADEDLEHTPVADISEDCICLAVTDAPLRFKSWIPRLAQPFLRI
ncbi:anti-ECFsigma factor, ChrR [Cribrihabitans marinus]|uniref:Anti-ECFsigma factor, ChrR n=1 Tax=Cribrihabitans marinus TaxID=1227549 RepID=A0A1H6XEU6_9RHOB|nr:ChrR family anti-sigma-E factor [Cribrihabitans marinus]GGH27271.1 anti-sigma-E factor ChrR [Cribrihabitans marinus]SEJ27649.1 anti-ECFsigma factor, ChrR [Cribrihabitans marinus]